MAIVSMLGAIENMKFFLCTGFGDAMSFMGGGIRPDQLHSPHRMGSDQHLHFKSTWKERAWGIFLCPITKLQQHLSAILYVDNTDILHIYLTKDKSIDDIHVSIQESVNSWGNLLIATGGVLQPSKCFYSITSFKWTNGEWKYANNLVRDKLGMSVTLLGGGKAAISHKGVNHAEKALGAMTSPDGNSAASIH